MCDACATEDRFSAVLNELDSSQAFLRKMRFELNHAVRELARHGRSLGWLYIFETANRAMNQATARHSHAVASFNLACRIGAPKTLGTDAVEETAEARLG